MPTVRDILEYVQALAPLSMKEDWDRVGLNCGHLDQPVTKILVALDPFYHVCREAKEMGAQLLVTHHTLLWEPGFLTDETEQGRCALFLIENGIAHLNAHTNLDQAPGGVNDCLAARLGLESVRVLKPLGRDEQGRELGLLRGGYVREQSLPQFAAQVKKALSCEGVRYVSGGKPVRYVAVGGGSCGSEMGDALAAGCDTFVTSDIKYNQFWEARALGLNLIDAGHFYTENPVVDCLAAAIAEKFPEIVVKKSETHWDCVKFL